MQDLRANIAQAATELTGIELEADGDVRRGSSVQRIPIGEIELDGENDDFNDEDDAIDEEIPNLVGVETPRKGSQESASTEETEDGLGGKVSSSFPACPLPGPGRPSLPRWSAGQEQGGQPVRPQ